MALLICWIAADESGPVTEVDDKPTAEPDDADEQNTALELIHYSNNQFHNYSHNDTLNIATTELLLNS